MSKLWWPIEFLGKGQQENLATKFAAVREVCSWLCFGPRVPARVAVQPLQRAKHASRPEHPGTPAHWTSLHTRHEHAHNSATASFPGAHGPSQCASVHGEQIGPAPPQRHSHGVAAVGPRRPRCHAERQARVPRGPAYLNTSAQQSSGFHQTHVSRGT